MFSKTALFSLLILATASLCLGSSPALIWSNFKSVTATKVSEEVVHGTDAVISTLLAATGKGESSVIDQSISQPEYIVAYLGKQADSSFLLQSDFATGPLSPVLQSAESWRLFQNTNYDGMDSAINIQQALADSDVQVQAIGCDGPSDLSVAEAAKQYTSSKKRAEVLLICSQAIDAAAEVAEVLALNQMLVLEKGDSKYLAVYAAEASRDMPAARMLVEKKKILTCGLQCKSQVAWLQGMLAAGVLLMALISGLSCTYLLDAPTKFEVPKDGSATS